MNPNMLIRFTVTPSPGISRKAPKKVNGSPAAVHTASRVDSVKNSTRKMSPRPNRPLRTIICRRSENESDAKYQGVAVNPSGSGAAATASTTASVVSRRRAPSARPTVKKTAGSPFRKASRRVSSKPSVTDATSPRRTRPPSGAPMSGMRAKSAAKNAAPSLRTAMSRDPVGIAPAGISAVARRTAATT